MKRLRTALGYEDALPRWPRVNKVLDAFLRAHGSSTDRRAGHYDAIDFSGAVDGVDRPQLSRAAHTVASLFSDAGGKSVAVQLAVTPVEGRRYRVTAVVVVSATVRFDIIGAMALLDNEPEFDFEPPIFEIIRDAGLTKARVMIDVDVPKS